MRISLLIFVSVLGSLLVGPLAVRNASGLPGLIVSDPANTWTPYGPHQTINHVLLKYYEDDAGEYTAFQNGGTDGLDITDSGQSGNGPASSDWPTYDANPDWNISAVQGGSVYQGLYFNGAASTWVKWGCDWQFYNSACGVEMRQAFAHLVDRPSFATGFGGLTPIWDNFAANKALANGQLMQSPPSNFCTWDTISNAGCNAATGPYKLGNSPTGFAAPGSPDFCLAADHMIKAGIATGKDGSTCVLTGVNPGVFSSPIRFLVRSTSPRRTLGLGFANSMDELFGAQVVLTHLCNINTCRYFIFNLPYTLDTWDAFTYGYQDTSPFPTYLYEQYSSKFSFTPGECPGGQNPNPEPPNTAFVCIPSLDTALSAAVNATSETSFDNLMVTGANSAFNILGRSAVVLPAYTFSVRTPALRSVDGLTNARGVGYETTQEELSAHKGPYVPVDPRYAFDGGGSSDALRWGQASPIDFLNPYQAGTVWEANTLFSVYDTLFATNPVAPNQVYCNMCQTVTPSVVGGNQEFTVTLRQNLRWQDGVPVDAFDIKFSLLTLRDEASNFSGGLLELLDVQVLSSSTLTITMRGQSVSHLLDLASPPIIPRHLWECPPNGQSAVSGFGPCNPSFYGDVGEADPGKVDPSYDPLAAGTFIGSGPFACLSVFPIDPGRLGTGCASNSDGSRAGQAISGTMTLTRYDFTGRLGATDPFAQWFRNNNPSWGTGSNSVAAESGQLQEFLWADRYDNGVVTILDLNSVASCVGRSSNGGPCTDYAYWNRPALHPATPTVVSNELAIVATHLDDEWINPYAWSPNSPSDATSGPLFNVVPMPTTCSSPSTPPGCYP